MAEITIRQVRPGDEDAVWAIFRTVVAAGDTYVYDPGISRDDALASWLGAGGWCYVAAEAGRVVGTYLLKANQPGLGAHVANAGYMVEPASQGRGVGRRMAEHSLDEARRLGFRAMQFNFVVSTNEGAIALWRKLGFEIVGRLPGAFHLRRERYVDALVMYRSLA